MHAEWARKAADAGKHILCEKPLAPTADEAAAIVAYCRSKSVKLMDGFMWPHHARTLRMRQLIDAGSIGDVIAVNGAFTFQLDLTAPNIRLQPGLGGGSLLDVGCYPVYGIRWAMGAEPVRAFTLIYGDAAGPYDAAQKAAPEFVMAYLGKAWPLAEKMSAHSAAKRSRL